MAITAADVQRMIVLEVGDLDPATGDPPVAGGAGMIASNISTIWATYADKALLAPRLQELYTKRRALEMLMGTILRHQVAVSQGDPTLSVRQDQRFLGAQKQYDNVQAEIDKVENMVAKTRGGAVGPITQQEPVTPQDARDRLNQQDLLYPDPGAPWYSGSGYYGRRRSI